MFQKIDFSQKSQNYQKGPICSKNWKESISMSFFSHFAIKSIILNISNILNIQQVSNYSRFLKKSKFSKNVQSSQKM